MLTEERVGELISAQTDELRADFDALDDKIGDLVNLGPEIERLSRSTDSLERSLVDIAAANRDALLALEEDIRAVEPLPGRVGILETKQGADDDARRDRASTWKTLKIVGAIAAAVLLPFLGFLGNAGWAHYQARGVQVVEQSHKIAANGAAVERHGTSPGHEPLRERVNTLEGEMVGINTSLENIQSTQAEARREQNEALQGLQREIRRRR